ncbi:motility associated factor glycosyltransferase family protein [uncultured Clostridium sp.]|uniref:motility associated factor glycosyltransferase family protein n=1 Tax=uncultured Clostridium sp. TaxID=59620 RepID=UPI0025D2E9CB|nr:6-hydroxymethylpterin diphosphokinase MptE-like protein [uncultured Clostridium sp.]
MNKRNIKLEYSRDKKPVLKVNNIYIHSKFYPEREAERFINGNKSIFENKNMVVVYGLALGYHIVQLLKRISRSCEVHVFDVDTEIYNIGKTLGCYDDIVRDNRVRLHIGMNSLNGLSKIKNFENIIIYNPSLKVLPDYYEKVKFIFKSFIVARQGIRKSKDIMKLNYLYNVKENTHTMREFFKEYNFKSKPVVIAASGPSLDFNINELKALSGMVKIFCVGSALRTLVKNKIIPDMICITDCNEVVSRQFRDYENLNVPLCFLSTASRWVVSNYKGPKYIFYNDKNSSRDIIINTAKTVSVSAMDIAVKGGASEILLVGQDLAFLNNRTHTVSFNETYGIRDSVEGYSKVYKKVKSVSGEILNTRYEYLNFKHSIEKEIENNPRVKFVNCSSGAEISGTEDIELSRWIDEKI